MSSTIRHRPTRATSLAARLGQSRVATRIEGEVRVTAADLVDRVAEAKLKVAAVRYKVEGEVRSKAEKLKSRVSEAKAKLGDEARFIKSWIDDPRRTGSVTPSSPALAKRMASYVDPEQPGPVIEIGPGTGPVTEALIERGIDESRLILVEYSGAFCALLRQRFPGVHFAHGDAYRMRHALGDLLAGDRPVAAVVSSLPLFTRPLPERVRLLDESFARMEPGAPFIQFSYALVPPVPHGAGRFEFERSGWVMRNLPPARVWTYRRSA